MDHFQTTWSQPTQGEVFSPGDPLSRATKTSGQLVKTKSASQIKKAQLQQLMKSQNATLERYLGPEKCVDDPMLNGFSLKSLPLQNSLDIKDESDIYHAGKSFEYYPKNNCTMPSHQLLPSQEVEKQGIQTPLQYKAAVMAAQQSSAALRKAKLNKSNSRLGEHLASGARPGGIRSGSRKSQKAVKRELSKSTENLTDAYRRTNIALKKSNDRSKNRLPTNTGIKTSKVTYWPKLPDKKARRASRHSSGHNRSKHARRMVNSNSTSGFKKRDVFHYRIHDLQRDLNASDGKANMPNDPYSFGNTGAAHPQKGSFQHDSALSIQESMGAVNQYTFMQKAAHPSRAGTGSPPYMHPHELERQFIKDAHMVDASDQDIRDCNHNISFFNSQKLTNASQFNGQRNCEVQMIVSNNHSNDISLYEFAQRSQLSRDQQNPFQPQLHQDAPVFSTVQPPESSAMKDADGGQSGIKIEERDTGRLTQHEHNVHPNYLTADDQAIRQLKSKMKFKSSSVLGAGPKNDQNVQKSQMCGDFVLDRSCTQPSRLVPDCLPVSEPEESLYQQQLTLTHGHSFDQGKSVQQASQFDHHFQPSYMFTSSQGPASKRRETNEAHMHQHHPNGSTLTSIGRANQARFGSKVMHIARKYNIELNPDKQHIFDDRERQSSMITSQTAYLSKGSSPQRGSHAQVNVLQHPHAAAALQKAHHLMPNHSNLNLLPSRLSIRRTSRTLNASAAHANQTQTTAGRNRYLQNRSNCSQNHKSGGKRSANSSKFSRKRAMTQMAENGHSQENLWRGQNIIQNDSRLSGMKRMSSKGMPSKSPAKRMGSKGPKGGKRSATKSNSVKRCINNFVSGLNSRKSKPNLYKSARIGLKKINNSQKPTNRGNVNQFRLGNTTQQSTIKACVGAGSKRVTSHDRYNNRSSHPSLLPKDWHPMRMSQCVGQESRTSLMTAITIKTQGNNPQPKPRSTKKKSTSKKHREMSARRYSAAHPVSHKKMVSGSLPKRFYFTGGIKTRIPSKHYSQSSQSRSKNWCSAPNSKPITKRTARNSQKRASNVRGNTRRNFKRDLQMADLYHREVMIRKFFCNWIEKFIERLRTKEEKELQIKPNHSAPYLPEKPPSNNVALDQVMTRTQSESRMSMRTSSACEPPIAPTEINLRNQETPLYKLRDYDHINSGGATDIAKFYNRQFASEDTSQKSPVNQISYQKGSNWRSKFHRAQNSATSGDRSSLSVIKSQKSRKSKSSISDYSKHSHLSRSRRKTKRSRSKGKRNLTATNDQFLVIDASKSSVPISQSFFDNVISPCSYYQRVRGTKPQHMANRSRTYLDRQQSFSAEHVGDNHRNAQNFFANSADHCNDYIEHDDVIEQLNAGVCNQGAAAHRESGPTIKLKNKPLDSGMRESRSKGQFIWQNVASDEVEEPSRNWFDRLKKPQTKKKSPLVRKYDGQEEYYEYNNEVKNQSEASGSQELRETAQLGQQIRRNEDLIFPLELHDEEKETFKKPGSSLHRRSRSGKSKRTQRGSKSRRKRTQEEGHRKSRLKQGLKILKRYQIRKYATQNRKKDLTKSGQILRTYTTLSRTSKQCSNSKSRGNQSRSKSREPSQRKRTKEAASRISTINHTIASHLPQQSLSISDNQADQNKSQFSQACNSKAQKQRVFAGTKTPPSNIQISHDEKSAKSRNESANSKKFFTYRRIISRESKPTTRRGSKTKSRSRSRSVSKSKSLSRSHKSQKLQCLSNSRHGHFTPSNDTKPKNATTVYSSTITPDDINQLKLQKYFLKWTSIARNLRERSQIKKFNRTRSQRKLRDKSPRNTPQKSATSPPYKRRSPSKSKSRSTKKKVRTQSKSKHRHRRSTPICGSPSSQKSKDPQLFMATEFHSNNLKLRVLRILYRYAFTSPRIVMLREQLRQRTKANLITKTFVVWIEALSQRMRERATEDWLDSRRAARDKDRVLRAWREVIGKNTEYRQRVLEAVPARCLLRMITQQDHIPTNVVQSNQDIGYELLTCTQYYQMKQVDQQQMEYSMQMYKRNLMHAILKTLKPVHLKHPAREFAMQRYRSIQLQRCWDGLLNYIQHQRTLQMKFQQVNYYREARIKSKLLKIWLTNLHEKNQMIRNQVKAGQYFRPKCFRKFFGQLKRYTAYRRAKVEKSDFYRTIYKQKIKQLAFKRLFGYTIKYRGLTEKFENVQLMSREYKRLNIIRQWCIIAAKSSKARLLYEWNLQSRALTNLSEAVALSQIRRERKERAKIYTIEKAQRQVFTFLKQYCMERRIEKGVKEQNKLVAEMHYLGRLFIHLQTQCAQKRKMRQITQLLQEEFKAKRLSQCFNQLRQNIEDQQELAERRIAFGLRYKANVFSQFRHAVKKQQALREALIQTLEKRNRARADFVLSNWRRLAFQKRVSKCDLQKKIYLFTVQRTIRKFKLTVNLNKDQRRVNQMCDEQYELHLKQQVWRALHQKQKNPKYVNLRKADMYRQKHLLLPCIQILKKVADLNKKYRLIRSSRDDKKQRELFQRWRYTLEMKRKNDCAVQFHNENILRKAITNLKSFLVIRYEHEMRMQKAQRHFNQYLKSKYFAWLQIQKQIIDSITEQKVQKNDKAIKHFMLKKLRKLSTFAKLSSKLAMKRAIIEQKRNKKRETKCFYHMLQEFRFRTNIQIAISFRDNKVGSTIFNEIRKQAARNKLVREILENHLESKHSEKKIAALQTLKQYKDQRLIKHKREEVALNHLCEFIQKKVFDILYYNAQKRKRLNALSNQLEAKTNHILKEKFIHEMITSFIVQPRLDAVADLYYKKKHLRRFKQKSDYIRERRQGGRLTDQEVKAFRLLGQNLLRKAFTSLKVAQQCRLLKIQEQKMVESFQRRRWFEVWRQAFILKSKSNYLLPIQEPAIGSSHTQSVQQSVRRSSHQGLPPRYRQSQQQILHNSVEPQLHDPNYFTNLHADSRQQYSNQKQANQSLISAGGAFFSTPNLQSAYQQPSTPSLQPVLRHQMSTVHAAKQQQMQMTHQTEVESLASAHQQREANLQFMAKKCQILSEKVQERIKTAGSVRGFNGDAQHNNQMSQGSLMLDSGVYSLEQAPYQAYNNTKQQQLHTSQHLPYNHGITSCEQETQPYGTHSNTLFGGYPSNQNVDSPQVLSGTHGSPQRRSPQKNQPRQNQLQQSGSPSKWHNDRSLHEYGKPLRIHDDGAGSNYPSVSATKVATVLSQPMHNTSFPPNIYSNRTEFDISSSQQTSNPSTSARPRSFKAYLKQNNPQQSERLLK